jgi:L-asparaginase II
MRTQVLVEIHRGEAVETRHRGALVVVDCQGSHVHVAGDPDQPVYIRSSIKPFVSAWLVTSGVADAMGLTDAELAIVAGSHAGTDVDCELVEGMLQRIGRSEDDLRNGTDGPADEATKLELARRGEPSGRLRQMCSGEHAGLLALAVHSGVPTDDYWAEDHPVQQSIADLVARLFGAGERMHTALDDCSLPTWRMPLSAVARGYSWLARPDRLPGELRDLEEGLGRVRDAMRAHPERISGPGQLDTDLTAADGGFVAKEGAEGLLAIGAVGTGLGIALTIEDGDKTRRAASVAAIATLTRLRLLDDGQEEDLRGRHWPTFQDAVGRTVADARAAFQLPAGE